jgi:hypothetical protein
VSADLFMQKPPVLSVYTNKKLQVLKSPQFVLYLKVPGPKSSIYPFQRNLSSLVGLASSKESLSALL